MSENTCYTCLKPAPEWALKCPQCGGTTALGDAQTPTRTKVLTILPWGILLIAIAVLAYFTRDWDLIRYGIP